MACPCTTRGLPVQAPWLVHADGFHSAGLAAAEAAGPSVAAFCEAVMAARPHPEQGFRTCFGILSLEKTYGRARLDAACRRGLLIGARSIHSILKTGLDQAFLDLGSDAEPLRHPNIRGQRYYN